MDIAALTTLLQALEHRRETEDRQREERYTALIERGTVCSARWDVGVVCKQLGCGSAVSAPGGAHFGAGSGTIWLAYVFCSGSESALQDCRSLGWGKTSFCNHALDAGVIWYTEYRLVGGPDSCSGRVELQYDGQWGTVCDRYWDLQDATVLCKQLNCGYAVSVPRQAWFGKGSGDVRADIFDCDGSETHISNCSISAWGRGACTHSNDAGVNCSALTCFIPPACAGRVEVYHNGSWGTVCDDSWDLADAEVVCKQLQCGTALNASVSASFGQGTGPICAVRGTNQLCGSVPQEEFKKLRLSRGCSGLAEVFYNGTWGSVCYNGMRENTVKMICHEVNCGESSEISMPRPTSSTARKWLDNVECRRHDSTLWQCPSSPWVEKKPTVSSIPKNCSEDLTQEHCSEPAELRLAGSSSPCSGRVEVRFEGSWGTVCDDSWDLKDAQVVCRQLGCGAAESTGGGVRLHLDKGTALSGWTRSLSIQAATTERHDHPSDSLHRAGSSALCGVGPVSRAAAAQQDAEERKGTDPFKETQSQEGIAEEELDPFHEAVYEEIEYKLARQGTYDAPRRGSFLSDELPSDYDDVEDSEGNPIPGESMSSLEGETPGYYDDTVPMNSNPEDLSGEFLQTCPVEKPCTKPSLGENLTGLTTMMLGRSLQERVGLCEAGSVFGGEKRGSWSPLEF
ncbi:UNVERIFIED_CONTAM: hypothetical protein FKN15_059963 [Acipenser sinensis]